MEVLQILSVDDEIGIREGIRRILRKHVIDFPYIEEQYSFEIDVAESGEEAVRMIDKKMYDIILVDNKLPGMQGTDILEYISKKNIDTIAMMITAFASIETAVAATKFGAYDFVTKPFTPDELKQAIYKAAKHLILSRITKKLSEEKNKIRFQFISVLSHELKSPIAAVSNYLKLMKERVVGNDLASYDKYIERSIQRMDEMSKLIFDMLDLTRIESGEKKRELVENDLVSVALESIAKFKEFAQERNVKFVTELPEKALLLSDHTELEIILNNLVSNAIKYNREGGTATVRIRYDEHFLILEVADTGIGIETSDLNKLFKEFSRIKNEKTQKISGSGIGLSTVKKIAQLYLGDATAESIPDEGTTFKITFLLTNNQK